VVFSVKVKRDGGKNDRMSLTGCRCGSLWDLVGLSIVTRREYWLVINRDGPFQFVKETYLDVSKLIPGFLFFIQRGLQAFVLSDDKKMRSSTTTVLKEREGLPCKLCKMVKILEPLSLLIY
jgi:hypothetical protein